MCGIAGVIGTPDAAVLVRSMNTVLQHRGPDRAGQVCLSAEASLGHRRLSILDLSARGEQPMRSADGRWTLVFNGEIFNYRELRGQLEAGTHGIPWRSETDTEVLLEAIAAWGIDRALQSTVGMFAFAAWDHQRQELTLARDRVGEKPLVYFHDGKVFAFASELKALAPLHGRVLNPRSVDAYLALGYVPAPLGIFRQTAKLPAGHLLRLRQGALSLVRWWRPETAMESPEARGRARRGQVRERIADAVRLRLRADVPVALSLSGGIDSSVLAAELAGQGASPDAFTVVFESANGQSATSAAELQAAGQVARQFGLRHQILKAESKPVDQRFEAMVAHYDEPFADSSAMPSLALAEALGGRYKVILNGDGGDEAFAGYPHYEFIGAKQVIKAAAASMGLRDGASSGTVYVQSKTLFRESERTGLLAQAPDAGEVAGSLDRLLTGDAYFQAASQTAQSALKRALWSDRHLYLANDLTHKMDIALSAFGIEGRAPLLDHRLLEWAQNLDDRDLVRGREKKVLLREAYANVLPAEVLSRPKQGFGAPVAAWLAGPLRATVERLLPSPLLDAALQKQVLLHPGGQAQRLWNLVTFAGWARHWEAQW